MFECDLSNISVIVFSVFFLFTEFGNICSTADRFLLLLLFVTNINIWLRDWWIRKMLTCALDKHAFIKFYHLICFNFMSILWRLCNIISHYFRNHSCVVDAIENAEFHLGDRWLCFWPGLFSVLADQMGIRKEKNHSNLKLIERFLAHFAISSKNAKFSIKKQNQKKYL